MTILMLNRNFNQTKTLLQQIKILKIMQGIFENQSLIHEIKLYQNITHSNYNSDADILSFETFLLTQDNISSNERQIHQVQDKNEDLEIEEKQEMEADQSEKIVKRKKQKPSITPDTRLSNYIFPNIVREVKQCLSNAFQAQNRPLSTLLSLTFKQLKINYQVWAFDAIFVILIFIRDKTNLLTHKKFSAVIDHISSTLSRYLAKFISKPFTTEQINYINNQYNHCINLLKVYDDAKYTFDTLCQKNGKDIKEEFFECVLMTRRRQRFKFVEYIRNVEKALSSGLVSDLIEKIIPSQTKASQKSKNENEDV